MMLRTIPLLVFLAGLFSGHAWAKECSRENAIAAESIPYYIESWYKMSEAFAFYGHCDDGSIAEAFSDSIVRLLASRWESVRELDRESRKNPAFKAFVLRHIDATAATEDLRRVESMSVYKCPKGLSSLCQQIQTAVKEAGRDQ
jgi:hypothetical protein